MNDAQYFADSGVSRTDLKNFSITPAHYKHFKENPKPDTAAMNFGRAYHLRVLEPELFKKEVGILDEDVKADKTKGWTAKSNIAAKQEFIEQNETVISEKEAEQIEEMAAVLYAKKHIREYLEDPKNSFEQERFSEYLGVRLKCKIDINNPVRNLDLKTTISAKPTDFYREIKYRKYYLQGGMYTDIDQDLKTDFNDPKPFGFIAQEKEPPHEASLIWLNHEFITDGIVEYRNLMEDLVNCINLDTFPGYEFWSMEADQGFICAPNPQNRS